MPEEDKKVYSNKQNLSAQRDKIGLPVSDLWLETVMKASPTGIGILVNRTILMVNEALCLLLGYSGEEMTGRNSEFLYPSREEYERVGREKYIDINRTGSGSLQTTFIRKDGVQIDVELSSTAIDRNDLSKGMVFTVSDITRVKHAEKKYSETVEKFETFFNSVDDALFVHPWKDNGFDFFVEVNDVACRRYGYTREEFLKMKAPEITDLSDAKKHARKQFRLTLSKNSSRIFETTHIAKNGRRFPVEINSNIVELSGRKYIMAVVRDISERIEAREEIRESEELNRNIIQTALDGFLSISLDGSIKDVNESYCQMTGFSRQELLSRKVTDLVATMNIEEVRGQIGTILSKGYARFESIHRRSDGNLIDVEIYARHLDLEGGLIVAFVKDITESKIDKKIMQTRLEMMSGLSDHSIDNLLQFSLDRAEELTNSRIGFMHLLADDQLALTRQSWSTGTLKALDKGMEEMRHIGIDKAGIWAEAARLGRPVIHNDYIAAQNKQGLPKNHLGLNRELVVPIYEGRQLKAVIGVGNKGSDYTEKDIDIVSRLGDITLSIYEKKRAEEELRESNYWLNEAQRISNSGNYIFNIPENIWTTSPVLNNILGIDPGYIKTLDSYFGLVHPEHREQMREYVMNNVIGEKKPFDRQYLIRRKSDGAKRWVHGLGQTIYDEDGSPIKIVGTIRDITDQKLAEIDLITAKEKAEESDRLKSTFLATMSHELRTPLNAVIGFSSLINEDADSASILEMNRYISENGYRLLRIIESIFDISMLETKNARLAIENFPAGEFFQSLDQVVKTEFEKNKRTGIEVLFHPDPDYANQDFLTDRVKLTQLMTNLINNAIRYTEKGVIRYGYTLVSDMVTFFVEDTGIGIPQEMTDVVFQKFRQVDESHTRRHDGVGLGLAICKEIATLLGGNLWVESELGKGSTFYFSLQNIVSHKRERVNTGNPKIIIPDLEGKTILVVEDVESNFLFLQKIIEKTRASVIWAKNGEESVSIVTANDNIGLVLMDIRMPVMNGFDATVEIKKRRPGLPVIAQTAYAMKEDESRIREAGCDDYIPKPIMMNQLFLLLIRYLA